jgi:hypothetical protein
MNMSLMQKDTDWWWEAHNKDLCVTIVPNFNLLFEARIEGLRIGQWLGHVPRFGPILIPKGQRLFVQSTLSFPPSIELERVP